MPAKAGIQGAAPALWTPAFAGARNGQDALTIRTR